MPEPPSSGMTTAAPTASATVAVTTARPRRRERRAGAATLGAATLGGGDAYGSLATMRDSRSAARSRCAAVISGVAGSRLRKVACRSERVHGIPPRGRWEGSRSSGGVEDDGARWSGAHEAQAVGHRGDAEDTTGFGASKPPRGPGRASIPWSAASSSRQAAARSTRATTDSGSAPGGDGVGTACARWTASASWRSMPRRVLRRQLRAMPKAQARCRSSPGGASS